MSAAHHADGGTARPVPPQADVPTATAGTATPSTEATQAREAVEVSAA